MCLSLWYNCNGWLGVKHQVTGLLSVSLSLSLSLHLSLSLPPSMCLSPLSLSACLPLSRSQLITFDGTESQEQRLQLSAQTCILSIIFSSFFLFFFIQLSLFLARHLKQMLQHCEKLRTFTSSDRNKWTESVELLIGLIPKCQHFFVQWYQQPDPVTTPKTLNSWTNRQPGGGGGDRACVAGVGGCEYVFVCANLCLCIYVCVCVDFECFKPSMTACKGLKE